MKSKTKYKFSTMFLITLLLLLTLGYAYLTQTLNINGLSKVNNASWNVYWDNVQVTSGSVEADTPTISNQTTVSFNVHLSKPGDFYEFTVDAKNDGTIDAMIDTITKTNNIPNYLEYTITYSSGLEIAQYNYLKANSKEVYKVRVEFKNDIDASDLPNSNQSINLTFGVTYVQADENAFQAVRVLYSNYFIGSDGILNDNYPYYDYYEDAIDEFNRNFFLRFDINDNNKAEDVYVGFVIDDEIFFLRGAGTTMTNGNYNEDSIYYESNKNTLIEAFGADNCEENNNNSLVYECNNGNLTAYTSTKGLATVIDNNTPWYCIAHPNKNAFCSND